MNKCLRSEQKQKDSVFWYNMQFFDLTQVHQVGLESRFAHLYWGMVHGSAEEYPALLTHCSSGKGFVSL